MCVFLSLFVALINKLSHAIFTGKGSSTNRFLCKWGCGTVLIDDVNSVSMDPHPQTSNRISTQVDEYLFSTCMMLFFCKPTIKAINHCVCVCVYILRVLGIPDSVKKYKR